MFHSTLSHRSPIPNPREKYLAALAEAKAAEAEYLAAERLQQEEDSLRQRLEQIQLLKHHNTPRSLDADFGSFYAPAHYPEPAPLSRGSDLDLLRRQIAAEERARIAHEQQQARELEALRKQQLARELDAQRKQQQQARELEALRIHEARKAQLARDNERAQSLAAQRARLAALTTRASEPTVRFVVSNENPKRHHCRSHQATRRELNQAAIDPAQFLKVLFATPKTQNETQPEPALNPEEFLTQLFGGRAQQQPKAPAPAQPAAPSLEQQFLHQFLGRAQPAAAPQKADTSAQQTVSLEQVLNHFLGGAAPQASTSAAAPQPKADTKPQQPAPSQAPANLEQLIHHILGAAGVELAQPSSSTAGPFEKEAVPAPAPSTATPAPAPTAAPKPAAQSSAPQAVGFDHILNQFLGGAGAHQSSPTPVDFHQLMNMFMGGHPHTHGQTPKAPEASSSKSAPSSGESALKEELEARLRSQQSSEERDLAEAIRMSLAEATVAPADSKGKAPAPAPVKDVTTSTAEVSSIDAAFSALSSEFVFPAELEFSTSRSASPARAGSEAQSAMERLSYSAKNQSVRFYQQALSGLLAQLDAVESFGDGGLRHARKEVVGRVESALDELEAVVEGKWRKFAGKEERAVTPVPIKAVAVKSPAATEAAEEAPVVVDAQEVPAQQEAPVVNEEPITAEPATIPDTTPDVAEPSPAAAADSTYPPATDSSYPPATESSYPPAAADSESVETLRPAASPAPSDIDTFLLPAASDEAPAKKPRASEEDVGSDWSEVDA
ncbi:hypothetical protein FB451DRAFT_1143148 [Mycena latifolia]|nr:hypothetical protein FB451DRAFT_1143148 [Mycena latifolia]